MPTIGELAAIFDRLYAGLRAFSYEAAEAVRDLQAVVNSVLPTAPAAPIAEPPVVSPAPTVTVSSEVAPPAPHG